MATPEVPNHRTRRKIRTALTGTAGLLGSLVLVDPLIPIVSAAVDPSTATVTGVVYADENGNGSQDANEEGIERVSVSDGATIVQTDETGRYTITTDVTRRITDMVFVSQPAGYTVGKDEYSTPRFYRNLGELADGAEERADFALVPDPRSHSNSFTFANIADPHANPGNPLRSAAAWKAQMAEISSTAQDLGFVQVSGDLTDRATDAEFESYRTGTAASPVPVWPAVGNHEYFYGGEPTYPARIDNYRRHVGPEWYSFDYGNRHFVVLENNGQAPFDEQFNWLRQDLSANARGRRVVVLTHQPMNVPFGSPSQYDQYGDLLEQYDTELVLVGHEHSNDPDNDPDWVEGAKHVQTSSSSYTIDHSPRGFRYVQMRGEDFANPFRQYGVEKSLTINLPSPGAEVSAATLDEIQVSAYDTSDEVRSARYRIDGGDWRTLRQSGAFTWFAELTEDRPGPGEHTVDVEATDASGAVWARSATFTVTNEPPVVPEAGTDWAQHHGDQRHSGVSPDVVDPADLALAWSHRTGGSFLTGSPVVADGVIYAATRDEDGEGRSTVRAVSFRTGETLWEHRTKISVHGSIAVADGVVYAQDLRSSLYALDADSGRLLWRRAPEGSGDPDVNQRSYGYYGVTAAEGKVFWTHQDRLGSGSRGSISALDPKSGRTLWEAPMSGSTMSDGTPVVADGRVYVGNQTADRMLAYDAGTGQRLWQSANTLGGWQDGVPTAADGRVFIGANNAVVARDAETGKDLWTYRSPGTSHIRGNATPASAAVVDNTVYMGFPDGNVTALDAATGSVVWSRTLPGRLDFGGVHSSPAVSGDTVYVGSNNGSAYALDRGTGAIVWEREIGTWVGAGPAVSGNSVVFGAWDGNLYTFTEQN